jgi:hypothetical protein
MADDSTDSLFGFILFILFLAFLGYAAGGVSSSSSTAGTAGGTSQSLPPLSGKSVDSCPATPPPQQDKSSDSATPPDLNLKVYVDPADPGKKCATATKNPLVAGTVKVTLAYTADKTQMVSSTGNQTASVNVSGTENFCVSAVATIIGIDDKVTDKVAIPKVVPCTMTAPAPQPMDDLPTRPDDKEDEEGY